MREEAAIQEALDNYGCDDKAAHPDCPMHGSIVMARLELCATFKGCVRLKRTFNMFGLRFWRVVGPANHPNINSDLSIEGLAEWGII